MDAIVAMTSAAAESMGLAKEVGAIAPGLAGRPGRGRRRSAERSDGADPGRLRDESGPALQAIAHSGTRAVFDAGHLRSRPVAAGRESRKTRRRPANRRRSDSTLLSPLEKRRWALTPACHTDAEPRTGFSPAAEPGRRRKWPASTSPVSERSGLVAGLVERPAAFHHHLHPAQRLDVAPSDRLPPQSGPRASPASPIPAASSRWNSVALPDVAAPSASASGHARNRPSSRARARCRRARTRRRRRRSTS